MLIGIDEAGMGSLAGPVTAAVVVLADDAQIKGARDSKTMTHEQQEEVAAEIMRVALFYEVDHLEAHTIDDCGISRCWLGMVRKLALVTHRRYEEEIIIDGGRLIGLPYVKPIVKADATHLAVSAASILAKYRQIGAMEDYHLQYPQYGFNVHHGYGTVAHKQALKEYGPCPIHRKSFGPVKKLLSPSSG